MGNVGALGFDGERLMDAVLLATAGDSQKSYDQLMLERWNI